MMPGCLLNQGIQILVRVIEGRQPHSRYLCIVSQDILPELDPEDDLQDEVGEHIARRLECHVPPVFWHFVELDLLPEPLDLNWLLVDSLDVLQKVLN